MQPTPRNGATDAAEPVDTRSLGALFRRLAADASALLRNELALAKAEARSGDRALAGAAARVAAGAALATAGLLSLLAAAVLALGDLFGGRYALSAALLGIVFLASGAVLAWLGVRQARRTSLAPRAAIETLRETGEWAKSEASDLRATLAGPSGDGIGRVAPDESYVGSGGTASNRAGSDRIGSTERGSDHIGSTGIGSTGTGSIGGRSIGGTSIDTDSGDTGSSDRNSSDRGGPPVAMPLWKRVAREFKEDDLSSQAAKVAYYFFLSLPPLLMALFGMAGLFGGAASADWLTARLQGSLPGEASALVRGFVDDVVREKHPGPLSIGLLLALWAGSNVFLALEDSLNAAYGITGRRPTIQRRARALGTLLAVSVLFLAGSAALIAGPAVSAALGLGAAGDAVWSVAQVPLGFALVVGAFWVIYFVLPNRDQRRRKLLLLKASAIAALLWVAASLAFRVYISNFGSYSQTYGLLGTVIVLLLWLYVTSLVILLGGEVASEMERTA